MGRTDECNSSNLRGNFVTCPRFPRIIRRKLIEINDNIGNSSHDRGVRFRYARI